MNMQIVDYVILAVTLLVVALFLVWYFRTREVQKSYGPTMSKNELVGVVPRYWKPIAIGTINKEINPIEKGQIDGNQNFPPSERSSLSKTEEKITTRIGSHYRTELSRIDQFKVIDSNKTLEDKFEILEDVIRGNGYKQNHERMKQDWFHKKSLFKTRIDSAIKDRDEAYDDLNRFTRENSIPITRIPFAPSKILKFIKILIPVALFSTEIYLNFEALRDATSISQAQYLSFTVASINVGLSFLVGYLVLTHFFNPVNVSKKPRILFYGFFFAMYTFVLAYLNFMLGVFRSLINAALEANNGVLAQQMTDNAFYDSVFPFDNLGSISFDGAFLLFMGFFFALVTMIDGYFFNDPIPGYQKVGDNLVSAKKRVEKLKNHDRLLFSVNQKRYEQDLETKHQYRLESVKVWGKYINIVQNLGDRFRDFKENLEHTLRTSIRNYRTANMEFRDTSPPVYFNSPHTNQFNTSFNDAYESFAEYNISDTERRAVMSKNTREINEEYADMVDAYREFFDNERIELDTFIKKLDDSDIKQRGI
jgi:hypothetical protein